MLNQCLPSITYILRTMQPDFLNFENQKLKECNNKTKPGIYSIFDRMIRFRYSCVSFWYHQFPFYHRSFDFSSAKYDLPSFLVSWFILIYTFVRFNTFLIVFVRALKFFSLIFPPKTQKRQWVVTMLPYDLGRLNKL